MEERIERVSMMRKGSFVLKQYDGEKKNVALGEREHTKTKTATRMLGRRDQEGESMMGEINKSLE